MRIEPRRFLARGVSARLARYSSLGWGAKIIDAAPKVQSVPLSLFGKNCPTAFTVETCFLLDLITFKHLFSIVTSMQL